ncbi:MAG TPA: peptidoglycan domain protein [Porphyromonadaceae bacterium]|nr:peptidoglycan domain protein [Porphyromonadaceae bacterium]
MAKVELLVPIILKWEGGFANDPDDLGGATNKGITFNTFSSYCRRKGYPKPTIERLKAITAAQWMDIMKTMYWDKWRADEIQSQSVANILVDWLWLSGSHGIKIPQSVLGVPADGIVGPQTINAVNREDPLTLFNKIKEARYQFIDRICQSRPINNKYKKGWINRLNDIDFEG